MRSKADETLVIVETSICPLQFSFGFGSYAAFIASMFCKIYKVLFKRFYDNVDFLGEKLLQNCYRVATD